MSASNGQYDKNRDANFLLTDEYENIVVLIVANPVPVNEVRRRYLLPLRPFRIAMIITSAAVLFWIRRFQRLRSTFFSSVLSILGITSYQSIRIIDRSRSGRILIGTLLFSGVFYNIFVSNYLFFMYTVHKDARGINSIEKLRTKKIPVFLDRADIDGSDFIKESIM